MENQQKTALITRATSGIGKELAKLFAKDGYYLIIENVAWKGSGVTSVKNELNIEETEYAF